MLMACSFWTGSGTTSYSVTRILVECGYGENALESTFYGYYEHRSFYHRKRSFDAVRQ
jgi:hypothetical protein